MKLHQLGSLRLFWLGNLVAIGIILSVLIGKQFGDTFAHLAYGSLVLFSYGVLFLLPGVLLTHFAAKLSFVLAAVLAIVYASFLAFFLYADSLIYGLYGFHFNGFVWNLLTTPGGIASMDSSSDSNLIAILKALAVIAAEVAWMIGSVFIARKKAFITKKATRYMLASWVVALLLCQLLFGFGRVLSWQPVITTAEKIPFFINTQTRGLAKAVGIKVNRDKHVKQGRLNYPLAAIESVENPWKPNIIWLVAESFRWDMLTPEIMPNFWQFSEQAHRFTNHYSGGNGTRMGVFSLFYGLPGSYWFAFLDAQRDPALIRLLQERDYQFGLFTSSDFTYPEFNRTVFSRFADSDLHVNNKKVTWENDRDNTDFMLEFLDNARQQPQPFFMFMFYNSPHARYQFPDDSVIRPDYLENFDYARSSVEDFKRDNEKIFNRYINSVHYMDKELGRLFDYIDQHNIKEDTIIIVTGDHAEEFMDVKRWGHNSEIHNAQIHTPFVMWIPGKGQGVHDEPTSHLDIVPTLLPMLGVTTDSKAYSQGQNLFDIDVNRYRISASWDEVAYIDEQYKIIVPIGKGSFKGPYFMTADDQAIENESEVRPQLQAKIVKILDDLSQFYR